MAMTTSAEVYFAEGCGRCALGGTPNCKVHKWANELKLLRQIVAQTTLVETSKWGMPCYTHQGKNVAMVAAFKDYCALSFFKGLLLADPDQLLEFAGENSQVAKLVKFTSAKQITEVAEQLRAYLFEAIEVERNGLKVPEKTTSLLDVPAELQSKLELQPELSRAFAALTPGRQRSHIIHISSAKQAATRRTRVEKCIPLIMQGKGWLER